MVKKVIYTRPSTAPFQETMQGIVTAQSLLEQKAYLFITQAPEGIDVADGLNETRLNASIAYSGKILVPANFHQEHWDTSMFELMTKEAPSRLAIDDTTSQNVVVMYMGSFPYIVQFTVSNDADDLEKLHTGFTIYTAEDDNEPQLAILRDELAAKLATPSDIKIRKTIEAWVRDNKALHNPEDWGEVSIVVPPFLNNPLELFTTRLEGPEVKEND